MPHSRRHGEDSEFGSLFIELQQLDAQSIVVEFARLMEIRDGAGMSPAENLRLRTLLAVLRSRGVDRHTEG